MNNIDILRNNKKYNEEYKKVKSDYNYLKNWITVTIENNEPVGCDTILSYYSQLMSYYEEYRELIFNNYHYDFIRNDNPMFLLNKFTEYMISIEELMTFMLDIDTEGECML